MAMFLLYAPILASFLCSLYLFHRRKHCTHPLLKDYFILGMLPPVIFNLWRIHDFITEVLKLRGGTGEFKGPWFTKMNYLITCDSLNVQHMLCKRFDNYIKGPEFREIFEPFGDGVVTADSDTWKYFRTVLHSLIKQRRFEVFVDQTVQKKVYTTLIPILDHAQQEKRVVDLQDIFNRFTFDNICSTIVGHDPKCLSFDFPEVAIEKAFNESEESIFYRHVVPGSVWKFQKWLQIGQEKKMTEACRTFDEFIYSCIASKREELSKCTEEETNEAPFDLLTALITEERGRVHDDKFLRDAAFNFFVAGRETMTSALTWFFWLVSKHPLVEAKILEEIRDHFKRNEKKNYDTVHYVVRQNHDQENYLKQYLSGEVLGMEEVKKLVYLHGALCEALRLFPPVPIERKQAVKADVLPSGHGVNADTMIMFSLYAMGRSEEIWGKDCLEFKPERWISERGEIAYAPAYKFIAFNAGPRICLGKDLAFVQMKMVAAAILNKYCFKVVEGHVATPTHSIVLLMKNGLEARITKRE
ncbi:alkane hydroxylase MAH1-like [Vigna unguiculata]|uniref:alkane hydroxylase MAH1-like n=1 Tax=Vigna unguiculata TaxID=3917 RepID=UPI0010168D0A|nr:alkane hydroxylase MAH1-like [Vigna unguiculata]